MLKNLIRERCTCAVLIAGLLSVSSLPVAYEDSSLQPRQSQSDASPAVARANPADQRGLILYFLMEATRAQVSH